MNKNDPAGQSTIPFSDPYLDLQDQQWKQIGS